MTRKAFNIMRNTIKTLLEHLLSYKKNVTKGKDVFIGMFSDLTNVHIGNFTYISGRAKLLNLKIGSYTYSQKLILCYVVFPLLNDQMLGNWPTKKLLRNYFCTMFFLNDSFLIHNIVIEVFIENGKNYI